MYEIYAYGNVDTLNGVFNAIAAIMGGDDYLGLIRTVAITGVLIAAAAGLFTPGRFYGWSWLFGFLFLYYALFLPKVDVAVIDKLGTQPPTVIGNVPIGVAFFGHYTSKVGDVMTRFFETAFQVIPSSSAQLPSELSYQKNGVLFGNRLIQASRKVNVLDPQLRTDLINYIHNCTLYDLQDGTINPQVFAQSTDIWSLMGSPNPGRFSTYGNPVQVAPCPNVYTYLNARLPAEVTRAKSVLGFQMNPSMDAASAQTAIDGQLEQAYYKARIAAAAQGAADLLRQNIMINLVQDASLIIPQKINDPSSVMLATARANATASINSSYVTMGKIAEQALPLIRNVIEAIIYAVFPFVFLLLIVAHGRGLALALKSFAMSLIWIQLWPPLYAILNYVATLASAKNLEAAATMAVGVQGLALETASSIYSGAVSDQAVAGYMVISIPIIATAIIKGGEVAFQAITGASSMQSAVASESNAASKGNVVQDSVAFDQQQLAPNRTSPYMTSTTDAHGTTIQGSGPDAGIFRYQATMSRLATTFTFSERQATTLADSAKEAETLAQSERDSMQRSQASALSNALGLQESFERTQQRSGGSITSDGGSTSTQLQTLNSVAKEVNRRLGLTNESLVGKTLTGAASAGIGIPFTAVRAQMAMQGQQADQERLQSAYDYARKAIETAQLSETSALLMEFRSSQAYQWARGTRIAGTTSLESSYREATEHQSASEQAYARSREYARAAQFMREWSSGMQTDFTNYAAQRLSERGLLREDDPITLQRAISEIAFAYAKGGNIGNHFVPEDNPLTPTKPLSQLLRWDSSELRSSFDSIDKRKSRDAVRSDASTTDLAVHRRQANERVVPVAPIADDLAGTVRRKSESTSATIHEQQGQILQTQGTRSEEYNETLNPRNISPDHGGHRATLDTVGVQTDNRAKLGIAPQRRDIGTWHFDERGDPVAGSAADVDSRKVPPPDKQAPRSDR